MPRLRLTVVGMLLWLAALYNLERLHAPINLASFVYVLTALAAAAIIFTPKIRTARLAEFSGVCLVLFAIIKWFLGYEFLGANLPITVTECVVICVTNLLAWTVAREVDELLQSVSTIASIRTSEAPPSFSEGHGQMYLEVQRARRFQRSLSLATVAFDGDLKHTDLRSLFEQAHQEIVRKHVESVVGRQLTSALAPGDLIVKRDDHFLVLFPETNEETTRATLQRLAERIKRDLGVNLRLGVAEFPEPECTLAGLVDRAEADMAWSESTKGLQAYSDVPLPLRPATDQQQHSQGNVLP